ncbi:MAG TPA: anthranilate synthase component I [Desulfomonilaceae bacterium]|nr:anthranilate synthase component I [Desulfomonilaceae bacterium]
MISPDIQNFERLCLQGNLIPMFTEIPGDLDTPLSAFLKIDDSRNSFLLESVEGGERWARYSFLGSEPRMVVKTTGGTTEIRENDGSTIVSEESDSTLTIRRLMARFQPVFIPGLPELFGGAVGFFSYDVVRDFERLPNFGKPGPGFRDACFMITRDMVVFDNLAHRILLITTVCPEEHDSVAAAYSDGIGRLERLKWQLDSPIPRVHGEPGYSAMPLVEANMSQSNFEDMVLRAKQHIKAGDIIQVVLSQRFETDIACDPLSVYRGLRMINPSPYMFFLRMEDEVLAGSSPEVMVRLRAGEAVVRPIAGTRPRGGSAKEDVSLEKELLSDTKEIAEHVMLVDLARNDLGRIAQPGSVTVDAFKTVERYSHVMHMVSNVRAKPVNGFDACDVLKATFPAGTLTGAPKIRAMEIIEELEPDRRGPYGGCVGYFSYTGAMDMGITIRTVMMKGSRAYFQSGAGIVADSVPEREYQETMKKAEAMRRALVLAQELHGRL